MAEIPNFKQVEPDFSQRIIDFETRFQDMKFEYEKQINNEILEREKMKTAKLMKQLEQAEKRMKAEMKAEKVVLELSKAICEFTTNLLKGKK